MFCEKIYLKSKIESYTRAHDLLIYVMGTASNSKQAFYYGKY